ncbi:hypothetical protein EDB80DRAFT_714103 [Ilyonectria destructans]|nr:hypothetical protein EDB80DRAFT_714103 [Ilyonectria destructans]
MTLSSSTPAARVADVSVTLRPRKPYSRSRTGCLTCRQKHLKCDENRPFCANCVNADRPCEYPIMGLPLRERRKRWLPGEQQPWTAPHTSHMPIVVSSKVDPFHCLPNGMPFRSSELLHYFSKLENPIGYGLTNKQTHCLSLAVQSPDALRNTLLIAGLHYAWNSGQLRNYESTFFFHKVEAMRLVNGWLKSLQPKMVAVCIREISTLAFTECGLGDLATAETHLDGLTRLMDLHEPVTIRNRPELGVEDELANRYFMLSYTFVHGVKSRLKDIIDTIDPLGTNVKLEPSEVESLMHKWHLEEVDGLETRLKSMTLFPAFFSPPPPRTVFQDIDGLPIIETLRQMTKMVTLSRRRDCVSPSGNGEPLDQVWLEGAPTRMLLAFVNLHSQSMSHSGKMMMVCNASDYMMASWSGVFSAASLYLQAVLVLWNAGQPLEPRLHRRVLLILKQDLDRLDYMEEPGNAVASDFWLWRAFLGAFSLARHHKCTQEMVQTLQPYFEDLIGRWILKTGITVWAKAKERLALIVWPDGFRHDDVAEAVWNCAVLQLTRG